MNCLKPFLASCILAAASISAPPAFAQSTADELKELDAQLPGKLVNDPSRIDWESYGPEFHAESFTDGELPGGAARRFHINRATEFIYSAGTNIPLTKSIKRGEQVTLGFYARTVESTEDDGHGVLRVRFQVDSPPYPGFGEETLSIGTEWDWYEVTTKAEQTLRAKDGIVAIQFGRTKQILEIGQAIIVTGADSISSGESRPVVAAPSFEPLIPEPLVGAGMLLNNPAERAWEYGGTSGKWEQEDESNIWLGKATRFASPSENAAPDLLYARIPIEREISEGDELLIAIAARAESAKTEDGRAKVGVMVQDRAKEHESFARNRFTLGPSWQLIRLKTKAPRSYPEGTAEVSLLFSWAEQEVDIGPVYVLKTN